MLHYELGPSSYTAPPPRVFGALQKEAKGWAVSQRTRTRFFNWLRETNYAWAMTWAMMVADKRRAASRVQSTASPFAVGDALSDSNSSNGATDDDDAPRAPADASVAVVAAVGGAVAQSSATAARSSSSARRKCRSGAPSSPSSAPQRASVRSSRRSSAPLLPMHNDHKLILNRQRERCRDGHATVTIINHTTRGATQEIGCGQQEGPSVTHLLRVRGRRGVATGEGATTSDPR